MICLVIGASFLSAACQRSDDSPHLVAAQVVTPVQAFDRVWERTDAPVADGLVSRTWIWGAHADSIQIAENYREASEGQRSVRYYDKSRMELSYPDSDPESPWYVTNGLLVVELMTGRRQVGDNEFEERHQSSIPVAGDPDSLDTPTYASLNALIDLPAREDGSAITEVVSRNGAIASDPTLADHGVVAAHRVSVLGIEHQVASPFWEFMNSSGLVSIDEELAHDLLFRSPFFATGYPLTEAYWINARVGGTERLILFQAFERRVLTYTPENPEGWQVESGNVGQHYYSWLYGPQQEPAPIPTGTLTSTPAPTPAPSVTAPPLPTATTELQLPERAEFVTVGAGAVDTWMRSVVRDADDRLWIVAIDNNQPQDGDLRPGRLVMYRATTPGQPTAFELVQGGVVDSPTPGGEINFADAALDAEYRLHIVWIDRGQAGVPLLYGVFDLATESWSVPATSLGDTALPAFGGNAGQGGVSIALDAAGHVRVAYVAAAQHRTQIRVLELENGNWSGSVEPLLQEESYVWHPALAVGPDGTWYLAGYDATRSEIVATHDAGQGWTAMELVDNDVLGPENIDQGPAMLVTPAGVPYVLYVDAQSYLRVRARHEGAWQELDIGGDYFTHAPGLGLFADGTLVVSGHDEHHPPHGMNVLYGSELGWSTWEQLVALEADGSAVFRWAGAFSTPSQGYVDLVFFDEDIDNDGAFDDQMLYYVAVPAPTP